MKPIKLDYRATIAPEWRADVARRVLKDVDSDTFDVPFGNLEVLPKFENTWMRELIGAAIKEYPEAQAPRLHSVYGVDVLYGKGSIGFHTDDVSTVIITLLDCFHDGEHYNAPEHEGDEGQLITAFGFETLGIGESCIFDGSKNHAWLCNGTWFMLSTEVKLASE